MDDNDVDHRSAAISMVALLIVCVEKAWGLTRRVAFRVKPLVTPPDSLKVDAGGPLYSGVLLIDRNDVLFGIVVQTGYEPPKSGSPPSMFSPSPASGPSTGTALERLRREQAEARDLFGDPRGRLPSWAETDDDYGGGSWRR